MGKEWLSWGGKSTKKGRSARGGDKQASAAAPTGCMCAVLQIFDLHHFPFALHHQSSFKPGSFLQDELPTVRKGLEAPRNSLELEKPFDEASSSSLSSSTMKQEENLNISVNIQIKTSCENKSARASTSKARTDDLLSECSSSSPGAGAKTPTLVARLMGIDQLPEGTNTAGSPSLLSSTLNSLTNLHMHPKGQSQRRETSRQNLHNRSCSNQYHRSFSDHNDISSGTHSLPETPRISSARRSDVEHRLSLQINKENLGEELEFSAYTARKLARRISESRLEDDSCKRSGHYARQIVKQAKESVSRKVGLDITNTIKRREQTWVDDHVVLLKPNKPSTNKVVSARLLGDESSQSKQSTTPSRLLEYPQNQSQLKPKPQAVPILQQNSACKKDGSSGKYNSRLKNPPQVSDPIRNKKEEPFIRSATTNKVNATDKKCKKTPLSNELLNITTVPQTLLPIKKDIPFPATKLGDKQASDAAKRSAPIIPSCSSQSYKQQPQKKVTHTLTFQENIQDRYCKASSTCTSTSPGYEASSVEYQHYIQRILKRTGIDKSTPISLAKWYSPSHPLDPSIFHFIELFHPTTIIGSSSFSNSKDSKLILRCNRRLIFQLVDELLAEILEPYLSFKPCYSLQPRGQLYGSDLIDALCSRIKKFPSANCQVLEDIDALVDIDLRTTLFQEVHEGEKMVLEIEREIMESLVHETVTEVVGLWLNG